MPPPKYFALSMIMIVVVITKGRMRMRWVGVRGVATQLHTLLVQNHVLSGSHLTLSMFTVTNALWSHISKFV